MAFYQQPQPITAAPKYPSNVLPGNVSYAQQPQAPGASKLYDIYRRRMNGFRRPQRPTVAQPQPYMAAPSYGVSKAPAPSMGPQPYAQPQPYMTAGPTAGSAMSKYQAPSMPMSGAYAQPQPLMANQMTNMANQERLIMQRAQARRY